MKAIAMFGVGVATVLAALPAMALKVTNLDSVPHKVMFEVAGARDVRTIEPDATEYFVGQPAGILSLADGSAKPSRGTLHADGILSGIVGAERNQNIPADPLDNFVIWPGGQLTVQQHLYQRRNF